MIKIDNNNEAFEIRKSTILTHEKGSLITNCIFCFKIKLFLF